MFTIEAQDTNVDLKAQIDAKGKFPQVIEKQVTNEVGSILDSEKSKYKIDLDKLLVTISTSNGLKKLEAYDPSNSDGIEADDGIIRLADSKDLDLSKYKHSANSRYANLDTMSDTSEFSSHQKDVIGFLEEKFPEHLNSETINLLSEGAREWTGNGQKLSTFLSFVEKLTRKRIFKIYRNKMKEYAPNFFVQIIERKDPMFVNLTTLLKSREEIAQLEKEIAQLEKEVAQGKEEIDKIRKKREKVEEETESLRKLNDFLTSNI